MDFRSLFAAKSRVCEYQGSVAGRYLLQIDSEKKEKGNTCEYSVSSNELQTETEGFDTQITGFNTLKNEQKGVIIL